MSSGRFVKNIFTGGMGLNTGIEQGRKVILLNSSSIVGILMLISLGTVALFQGHLLICTLDYTVGGILIAVMLNFRKKGIIGTIWSGKKKLQIFKRRKPSCQAKKILQKTQIMQKATFWQT